MTMDPLLPLTALKRLYGPLKGTTMAKLTISHNGVTANFSQRKRTGKRAKKAERKRLKIESRRISRIEREGTERKEQDVLKKEEKAFVDRQAERDKQKQRIMDKQLESEKNYINETPLPDLIVLAYKMIDNLQKKGTVLTPREKKIFEMLEPYATRVAEKEKRMARSVLDI